MMLQMTMTLNNFDLEPGTDADVMQAVRFAARLPFRAGVSKTMVLLACNECNEMQERYSDMQRLLVNNDIHLHVLVHEILRLKSRSPKTAYIYGKLFFLQIECVFTYSVLFSKDIGLRRVNKLHSAVSNPICFKYSLHQHCHVMQLQF